MNCIVMIASTFRAAMACAASLCMLLPLAARQAPPFGDSLTWDTGKESPSLERLRGKSVMMVFFQDWCGICNAWSGDLFRQLGEAYGDDPAVVLIAIKTDGGSIRDAHGYLESRTELRHWMVAVDENAAYYRQATGQTKLYHYLWVAPDGSVAETGKAGRYYSNEPTKRFVLAGVETRPKIRKDAVALMSFDPPLSGEFQEAVKLAENGLFLSALGEASKLSGSGTTRDDSARFRKRIAGLVQASVDHHKKILEEEAGEYRYLSYLALRGIERDFGTSSPGMAAREAVAGHSGAGWIAAEEKAESEYKSIMRRAARADDERAKARIDRALEKLAESHPDTVYGRIAASSGGG